MNILAYAHAFVGSGHNAGAETTLHDILRTVKARGHPVMGLGSRPFKDGSGSYVIDGIKIQAFGSKRDPILHFPEYDIIITHLECAQRADYIAQSLPEKPKVVQLVHNDTEYSRTIAERYCDFLVFNTRHVADKLSYIDKPSVILHPIVDPQRYEIDSTREYITLVNLSDGELPFYDKGYRVFYHLADKFPELKFLGVKGAYGNQVVINRPNVTIVDHTDNILNIYRKTKLILMPSEIESFGRIAVEAGCSGIPSIVSDTDGLKEAKVGTGLLPHDAYGMWEDELRFTLDHYSYYSKRARINTQLLWDKTQDEILDFFQFLEKVVMNG